MSAHVPTPDAARPSAPQDPERFKIGTLLYSKAGLITLFLFLLWGDFCFTIIEIVVPSILPLELNALGAPNWMLGLIVTTIPNIMAAVFNPVVSVRSDRFRSRWGRRIPFLLIATPFVAFFMVLLGYAAPIGRWLHGAVLTGRFSETTVILVVIGVCMVVYEFFNLIISAVYYYLFNDVVPHAFLARFMALFRVVGTAAGAAYNFFILKYAGSHSKEIFLCTAILYCIAFVMMCWKVKEGAYPPPAPYVGGKAGFVAALRTYARECFTHRFYWFLFLANTCSAMTWASGSYQLLFKAKYLGLDLDFIGKVLGVSGVISMLLLYPAGIYADRAHPLRVLLLATVLQAVTGPLMIALAMFRPVLAPDMVSTIYVVLVFVTLPIGTLYRAAELPTLMQVFPQDRYGQFCSANALIRSLALIVGGIACGAFLDLMTKLHPDPAYGYRFVPVWNTFFLIGACIFTWLLFREWKRLGGKEAFKPPVPDAPAPAVA
ncbi:MAG: MFS transporter [Rariglobus sp.]